MLSPIKPPKNNRAHLLISLHYCLVLFIM